MCRAALSATSFLLLSAAISSCVVYSTAVCVAAFLTWRMLTAVVSRPHQAAMNEFPPFNIPS